MRRFVSVDPKRIGTEDLDWGGIERGSDRRRQGGGAWIVRGAEDGVVEPRRAEPQGRRGVREKAWHPAAAQGLHRTALHQPSRKSLWISQAALREAGKGRPPSINLLLQRSEPLDDTLPSTTLILPLNSQTTTFVPDYHRGTMHLFGLTPGFWSARRQNEMAVAALILCSAVVWAGPRDAASVGVLSNLEDLHSVEQFYANYWTDI